MPSTFEKRKKRPIVPRKGHTLPQRRPGRRPRPPSDGDLCPTALLSGSSKAGGHRPSASCKGRLHDVSLPAQVVSLPRGRGGGVGWIESLSPRRPFFPQASDLDRRPHGPHASPKISSSPGWGDLVARRAWSGDTQLHYAVLCCAGAGPGWAVRQESPKESPTNPSD